MASGVPAPRCVLATAMAVAALTACAWNPWIPGEGRKKPEIVVDPSALAEQLPLDAHHVDELDCYSHRCQKRYRVVVDGPGRLAVRVVPGLTHPDAGLRLVLESVQGVLDRAGSGRGHAEDVVALDVGAPVERGVYFVLLQSVGGPLPYQITATHHPGAGPMPEPATVVAAPPAPAAPPGPPPHLVEVDVSGPGKASYDAAVSFERLRTFRFPAAAGPGAPAGTPLETPLDRQIRRLLADDLRWKGLRQAHGAEDADLVVHFTRGAYTGAYQPFVVLYDWYGFGVPVALGPDRVDTRGLLTVDLVDARSNRIAWHAWTTKGLGPGITPGEKTDALLREAVSEVLAPFPPS